MSSSPTEGPAASGGERPAAKESLVEVTMPQMGVSVAEGTVAVWHKRVGDWVTAEETVCEITTDKIDSEVPAPASGRVVEIVVDVDETVPVGSVLARIETGVPAGEAHPDEQLDGSAGEANPPEPTTDPTPARAAAQAPSSDRGASATVPAPRDGPAERGRRYSPVVLRIARSEGVDLAQIQGSGRGGRVQKQDVLAYIQRRENGEHARAAPSDAEPPLHIESPYREPDETPAAEGTETERLSRMRRTIAEHMLRSLSTAAHCTSIVEADMSAVQAAREALGLTYLPFVARCAIEALRAHPELNATLEGESLTRHRAVNLGIAVSLDREGLVVPVIHDAQDLSPEGLARRIAELARRARAGQLSPDDVHGGTFTITNPGASGTLASTPIINQPQVAILDLEAVVKRPIVLTDGAGQDSIAIRPMTYLCLSWDHRALDGALAAQFLATLRRRIESWGRA